MQKVNRLDDKERLIRLLDKFEPRIRDSFISAVNSSKDSLVINELTRLLENGLIEQAVELTDSIPLSVSNSVDISFTETGASTAETIASITNRPVFFDQTNQMAVNAMRRNRAKLIVEFRSSQREAVQEVVIDGIQRGLNPIDQARNFRDSVGLTRRQVRAVNKFRNLLQTGDRAALTRELRDRRFDRTINNAINSERPLTQRQIDRMVQRYRERYIKFRAETIARTEALRSVHEANDIGFRQQIEAGILREDQVERTWFVTRDERLRSSHSAMSGQTRGLNEAFISGNGNALMFPGDPSAPASDIVQCRCSLTTRLKDI